MNSHRGLIARNQSVSFGNVDNPDLTPCFSSTSTWKLYVPVLDSVFESTIAVGVLSPARSVT